MGKSSKDTWFTSKALCLNSGLLFFKAKDCRRLVMSSESLTIFSFSTHYVESWWQLRFCVIASVSGQSTHVRSTGLAGVGWTRSGSWTTRGRKE